MTGFLLGAVVFLASPAPKDGDAVLRLLDSVVTGPKDQLLQYELLTTEAGKKDRLISFKVFTKGKNWRRVEFLGPADLRGMRTLVRSPTQSYVWLPAFRKVRRLATHTKEQGFMGTSFSEHEMSMTELAPIFKAKLLENTDKYWKVEGVRRKGQDVPFSKIVLTIRKDVKQAAETQFYNNDGMLVKTERRLDYVCSDPKHCTAKVIEMVDHTRNALKSQLKLKEWKIDVGLKDSFFTLRALQRGART